MVQLTPTQQYIWIDQKLNPHSAKYNLGGYACLHADINRDKFEQALQTLIDHSDAFRGVLIDNDNLPHWLFPSSTEFSLEFKDFSGEPDADEKCIIWMRGDMELPFAIETSRLFYFSLLRAGDGKYYWYAKVHHLITDGWGVSLLFKRMGEIYSSLVQQGEYATTRTFSFADHCVDFQEYLTSGQYQRDQKFWLEKLSDPADCILSKKNDYRIGITDKIVSHRNFSVDADSYAHIKQYAADHNASLFHIFLATLSLFFCRTYNQSRLAIGIPILNRSDVNSKNTIGIFMNVLPLQISLDWRMTFIDLIQLVKNELMQCYRYSKYPLGDLVKHLKSKSLMSEGLFNIRLSYEKHEYGVTFGAADAEIRSLPNGWEDVELSIKIREFAHDTDVVFDFDYSQDAFDEQEIESVLLHLKNFMLHLPDADSALTDLCLLTVAEKDKLLSFNATCRQDPSNKTVIDIFKEQAALNPYATAISFRGKKISYKELERASDLLAELFIRDGIERHGYVPICIEKSESLVAGILGILKAGAAFIPLDPEMAPGRIAQILNDAKSTIVVSDSKCCHVLGSDVEARIIKIDDLPIGGDVEPSGMLPRCDPSDLAYLIYTSGTTGTPKGVMVSHANLLNSGLNWREAYHLGSAPSTILSLASVSFDVFVGDICRALLNSAVLVLPDESRKLDIEYLTSLITIEKVNVFESTPLLIEGLAQYVKEQKIIFPDLRLLISGSDTLRRKQFDVIKEAFPYVRFLNSYGVTEATIDSSFFEGEWVANDLVPIGKPMGNTSLYVLDRCGQPVPIGMKGELYIGGSGVAVGYMDDHKHTIEKFIDLSLFSQSIRAYKTGDQARWLQDGNIEFLGRNDDQIKIRAYRIEPREVENTILTLDTVQNCVVLPHERSDGSRFLVAYIIPRKEIPESELRTYLSALLPPYMIPDNFIFLQQIPHTINGKIDRRALPKPLSLDADDFVVQPESLDSLGLQVLNIWTEVLGQGSLRFGDNFFNLGGHSLKAVQIQSRIRKQLHIEIDLKDIFIHNTFGAFLNFILSRNVKMFEPIPIAATCDLYPLSRAQYGMWVACQSPEGSTAYNITGAWEIYGRFDTTAFNQAMNEVIARNDALRTVFVTGEDDHSFSPWQFVLSADQVKFELKTQELDENSSADASIKRIASEEQLLPFDLSKPLLLRGRMLKIREDYRVLFFTVHHLVCDGWSVRLLMESVADAYKAATSNSLPNKSVPKLEYKDYVAWQQQNLASDKSKVHESYWLKQLSGELSVLNLPCDYVRPAIKTYLGSSIERVLSGPTLEGLKKLCYSTGNTLFTGLLATVKALFYRYSCQEDIIVGTPIVGREHSDLEDQIGLYVNTLPLRTRLNGKESFTELLDKEKQVLLDAYKHQAYPFDMLVEKVGVSKDVSRSPLFDVLVVLHNQNSLFPRNSISFDRFGMRKIEGIVSETSQFDLSLIFSEAAESLHISAVYNTDIFSGENVEQLMRHFENFLQACLSQPDAPVSGVTYLSSEEEELLLRAFNSTEVDYPRELTIVDLFERQVEKTPDAVAVVFGQSRLSYAQLNERANQLAHFLRSEYAIKADDLVGLMVDRSERMIIGMIAILKAGAAYVPIDPEYPQERISYIIQDCQAKVILVNTANNTKSEIPCFAFEEDEALLEKFSTSNPVHITSPGDLVYVIYTSGSTGRPKGVMIEGDSLNNFLIDMKQRLGFTSKDTVLALTSCSFDISLLEIFLPLICGGKVVIANSREVLDGDRWAKVMSEFKPTMVQGTPTFFRSLLPHIKTRYHMTVVCGGEPLTKDLALMLIDKFAVVWNMYGPTETTVWSTALRVDNLEITIGKPIANTSIYILDPQNMLVPVGVPGEVYIAGNGLARGYINNRQLTQRSFKHNPFKNNTRMYKTGDVGKWTPQGKIQLSGRKDHQIKINGHRIELGEIESVLLSHEKIDGAAVCAWDHSETGNKYLSAYLTSTIKVSTEEIRKYVMDFVPSYAVPSRFLLLDALPVTANGKVDRSRLTPPVLTQRKEVLLPTNDVEHNLAEIWKDVLRADPISIEDSFFELGGDSIRCIEVVSRLRKVGYHVGVEQILEHHVLKDLAKKVTKISHGGQDPVNKHDKEQPPDSFSPQRF